MEEHVAQCRICYGEDQPLISPCKCAGTIEHAHSDCLKRHLMIAQTTRSIRRKHIIRNAFRCGVCKMYMPVRKTRSKLRRGVSYLVAFLLVVLIGLALGASVCKVDFAVHEHLPRKESVHASIYIAEMIYDEAKFMVFHFTRSLLAEPLEIHDDSDTGTCGLERISYGYGIYRGNNTYAIYREEGDTSVFLNSITCEDGPGYRCHYLFVRELYRRALNEPKQEARARPPYLLADIAVYGLLYLPLFFFFVVRRCNLIRALEPLLLLVCILFIVFNEMGVYFIGCAENAHLPRFLRPLFGPQAPFAQLHTWLYLIMFFGAMSASVYLVYINTKILAGRIYLSQSRRGAMEKLRVLCSIRLSERDLEIEFLSRKDSEYADNKRMLQSLDEQ